MRYASRLFGLLLLGLALALSSPAGSVHAEEQAGEGGEGIQDPAYDAGIENTIGDTSTSMPIGEPQAEVEAEDPGAVSLSPSQKQSVEEIVVSARKRAELLEDTPLAVSVVTPTELTEAGITDITQLDQVVPNLQINRSGSGASFVIRGVGAFPQPYFDQGVGLYVDGVYIPRQQGNITEMVDIQQIEVLRGPQGTLFGKNSAGGAVKITTAPPDQETEAFARVRYNTNGLVQTRSTLNFPAPLPGLEDELAFRLNFASTNFSGGHTVNLYELQPVSEAQRAGLEPFEPELAPDGTPIYPRKYGETNANNANNLNFLGAMRWTPHDDVILDVSGMWNRNWSRGAAGRCVRIQESQYQAVMDVPHTAAPYFNPYTSQDYYDACDAAQPYNVSFDTPQVSSQTTAMAWGSLLWDVGELGGLSDLQFKALTSWRGFETYGRTDLDGTQYWIWEVDSTGGNPLGGSPTTGWSITEELQVNASAFDERLNFVAGAFGFAESVSDDTLLRVLPGTLGDVGSGTTKGTFTTNNWDWSLYGQADFTVTNWLQLIGGVRFAQESKAIERLRVMPRGLVGTDGNSVYPGPIQCQPGTGGITGIDCIQVGDASTPNNRVPNSGECAPGTGPRAEYGPDGEIIEYVPGDRECEPVGWTASQKFTNWSPLASIKLTLPDRYLDGFWLEHLMGYFQYTRGYKGGGFNGGALDNDPRQRGSFAPEYNDSFEVGMKTIQFEDRLNISLALFYSDYQDLQLPTVETFNPPPGCVPTQVAQDAGITECLPTVVTLTRNVPGATIKGIEVEVKARPLPFLIIDWDLGYMDARLDDFPNAENPLTGQPEDVSGQKFSFVPSLNTHVAVSVPLPVDFEFLPDVFSGLIQPRLDYTYRGEIQWFSPRLNEGITKDAALQPPMNLLNLRVGYFFNDNQTQVAIFGENLLNEKYNAGIAPFGQRILGSVLQYWTLGASFGFEVSHTF